MPAAWDLLPDSERTADSYTTFILFCEDDVQEPGYFRSFQRDQKVKINIVEGQKSSFRNIANMLAYCEMEGLLDPNGASYQLKAGITDHLWCVYDRDIREPDPAQADPQENHAFSLSIQAAQHAGINVAWSNDVFELWILLHFEAVEPGIWQHRDQIYDRLTAVFRALPNQSPELAAITSHPKFRYETTFKKRNRFAQFVMPQLAGRLNVARERAEVLEAAFQPQVRQHERNPCTMVHRLVESILSFF